MAYEQMPMCRYICKNEVYFLQHKRVGNYSGTKIPENGYTHTTLRTND